MLGLDLDTQQGQQVGVAQVQPGCVEQAPLLETLSTAFPRRMLLQPAEPGVEQTVELPSNPGSGLSDHQGELVTLDRRRNPAKVPRSRLHHGRVLPVEESPLRSALGTVSSAVSVVDGCAHLDRWRVVGQVQVPAAVVHLVRRFAEQCRALPNDLHLLLSRAPLTHALDHREPLSHDPAVHPIQPCVQRRPLPSCRRPFTSDVERILSRTGRPGHPDTRPVPPWVTTAAGASARTRPRSSRRPVQRRAVGYGRHGQRT